MWSKLKVFILSVHTKQQFFHSALQQLVKILQLLGKYILYICTLLLSQIIHSENDFFSLQSIDYKARVDILSIENVYYIQRSTNPRAVADQVNYLSLLLRRSVVTGSCWMVWCNIRASSPARLVMAVLTFRSCSKSSSNLYHCVQREKKKVNIFKFPFSIKK